MNPRDILMYMWGVGTTIVWTLGWLHWTPRRMIQWDTSPALFLVGAMSTIGLVIAIAGGAFPPDDNGGNNET